MTPLQLHAAVLAALEPARFPVITGEVHDAPGHDYAVLLPGGGRGESDRATDSPNVLVWTVRVVAVSATPQGCLAVADWVRSRLDRLRIGMSLLRDDSWGNVMPLPDGPANDRRYSVPLDFTITTERNTTP